MSRKGLVVAVIFLFLGISVIPSTGTVVEKKFTMPTNYDGNTLYVGGSGSGNYSKIQDAINDATNSNTFIYNLCILLWYGTAQCNFKLGYYNLLSMLEIAFAL